MDLSFSGAGFMGTYYIGVLDCWTKFVPRERVNRTAGASAGSLTAAYYLMDEPLDRCLFEIAGLIEGVRQRPLGVFDRRNQIVDLLPVVLDALFPDDCHKRVSGRLFVAMTRLKDMKKVIVSEFDTKKDLIDALNCSCFIPLWSGSHVSTYKGEKHIDGGFSDNLPVFDEHTIRICCFSGGCDISPYDRSRLKMLAAKVANTPVNFNFQNCKRLGKALFPPTPAYILQLLKRGFHDTRDFLLSNDLIQCDECYRATDVAERPIYALDMPTITPRGSPRPSRSNSVSGKQCPAASKLALDDLRAINKAEALSHSKPAPQAKLASTAEEAAKPSSSSSFAKLLKRKLSSLSVAATGNGAAQRHAGGKTPEAFSDCQPTLSAGVAVPTIVTSDADADAATTQHDELRDKLAALTKDANNNNNNNDVEEDKENVQRALPKLSVKFEERRGSLSPRTPLPKGLAVESRFAFAATSCPPSPSLNRTCAECSRLRQAARLAELSDELVKVAQKFEADMPARRTLLPVPKLAKRARKLRSLLIKNSYKPHASIPT